MGQAVLENRVVKILFETGSMVPGRINSDTQQLEIAPEPEITDSDITDDLAKLVLQNGGEVFILPAASMPSKTGIAAIFRY